VKPSTPIHLGMTFVRSVMVAVPNVNTAAIRNAYTCSTSRVIWRLMAGVSGGGLPTAPPRWRSARHRRRPRRTTWHQQQPAA
jgi:hypothetical protein